MPGTFRTVYFVAFDLDTRGQTVRAFPPRVAANEASAIEAARVLWRRHAGAIVWRRESNTLVGEEGNLKVVFKVGMVGDVA
jgi:hypothetical protein